MRKNRILKPLFPVLPKAIPNELKYIKQFLPKNLYTYLKANYQKIITDCKNIFNDNKDNTYEFYSYFEHIAPNLTNSVFNIMCDAAIFVTNDKLVLVYDRRHKKPTFLTSFLIDAFLDFFRWIYVSKDYLSYKKGLWTNYLCKHLIFIEGKESLSAYLPTTLLKS